jgi:NADH-quinone oxidoreductase subunit J
MTALSAIYFYSCALLSVLGALAVIIAKNPIRGAMGLLLLILSVAGLFLPLQAQFLAAIQLIVYAGAIVVLFLFVIMLLGPNARTPNDRRGAVWRTFAGGLFAAAGVGSMIVSARAMASAHSRMPAPAVDNSFGGIEAIGSVLFSDALIPFELSSALLMIAVIGATAVARGRQGTTELSKGQRQAAKSSAASDEPFRGSSGVFSHESSGAAPLQPSASETRGHTA